MAEWDREISVDPEAVWRAAGSPGSWRHLATGWDCDAWIADESLVWRAPRRNVGIAALEREAAVMPILAPRLPAPVPVPVLFEPPDLPALARHVWIPGVEMAEARETDPGLGRALGRFLAALHRPERVEETRGRLPADPLGRADPERRLPVAHRRLDEIAGRTDVEPLRRIVDAAAGPPLSLEVVCHGDLHLRHALIDAAGGLAGVIDWGDCCVGAKGVDLAIATALTFEQRSAFLDAYGSVDESSWRHARMLAVTLGAALLAADPAGIVGAAALRWLGRITEEP